MMATRRTSEARRDAGRAVANEAAGLVRQEIEMARDQVVDKLKGAAVDVGMLGVAAGAGVAGAMALTLAVTDVLHGRTPGRGRGMPLWGAAGATGALAIGLGTALAVNAVTDLRHRDIVPRQAAQEVGQAAQDVVGDLRDQH
jgi:hypothetical protein